MDFTLPEELTALLARIDEFIENVIRPLEEQDDNRRFFDLPLPGRSEPIGSPGGADDFGPAGADTELTAAADAPS